MPRRWLAQLSGSPVFSVCLVLLTGALAFAMYRVQARSLAPTFVGWTWAAHPKALLVGYRPDCGCSIGAGQWAVEGITHHLDVLIVSEKPAQEELSAISKIYPHSRVETRVGVDAATMRRLCPNNKTTALFVRDGCIVRAASGKFDFLTFANER